MPHSQTYTLKKHWQQYKITHRNRTCFGAGGGGTWTRFSSSSSSAGCVSTCALSPSAPSSSSASSSCCSSSSTTLPDIKKINVCVNWISKLCANYERVYVCECFFVYVCVRVFLFWLYKKSKCCCKSTWRNIFLGAGAASEDIKWISICENYFSIRVSVCIF